MDRFDEMLMLSSEVIKDDPILEQTIEIITPWRKILMYLMGGICLGWLSISIKGNVLIEIVNILQSAIAVMLLCKGTSMCRKENTFFRQAYNLSIISLITFSISCLISYTPLACRMSTVLVITGILFRLLKIATVFEFYRGLIKFANRNIHRTISKSMKISIGLYLFFYAYVLAAYCVQSANYELSLTFEIITVIIYITGFIVIFRLYDGLSGALKYYGYNLTPPDYNDRIRTRKIYFTAFSITCLLIFITGAVRWVMYVSSPNEVKELTAGGTMDEKDKESIKTNMIKLGMEERVVDDLLDDELLYYKDVDKIETDEKCRYVKNAKSNINIKIYVASKETDNGKLKLHTLYYAEWDKTPYRTNKVIFEAFESLTDKTGIVSHNRMIGICNYNGMDKYYDIYENNSTNTYTWTMKDKAQNYRAYVSSDSEINIPDNRYLIDYGLNGMYKPKEKKNILEFIFIQDDNTDYEQEEPLNMFNTEISTMFTYHVE